MKKLISTILLLFVLTVSGGENMYAQSLYNKVQKGVNAAKAKHRSQRAAAEAAGKKSAQTTQKINQSVDRSQQAAEIMKASDDVGMLKSKNSRRPKDGKQGTRMMTNAAQRDGVMVRGQSDSNGRHHNKVIPLSERNSIGTTQAFNIEGNSNSPTYKQAVDFENRAKEEDSRPPLGEVDENDVYSGSGSMGTKNKKSGMSDNVAQDTNNNDLASQQPGAPKPLGQLSSDVAIARITDAMKERCVIPSGKPLDIENDLEANLAIKRTLSKWMTDANLPKDISEGIVPVIKLTSTSGKERCILPLTGCDGGKRRIYTVACREYFK